MDLFYRNLTQFFEDQLQDLSCQQDTKAYIIGIYGKYKNAHFDLSKDSPTLLLAQGHQTQDFAIYQNLGDWIFFSHTLIPNALHGASKNYYDTIARISYYSCYRLINRQWTLFEELADNLPQLEYQVQQKLGDLAIPLTTSGDTSIYLCDG